MSRMLRRNIATVRSESKFHVSIGWDTIAPP